MAQFTAYERIIVLALDSVTWDLLLPFANDGTMPALGAFLKGASYGVLESTVPPHTAPAWTTFLTGKDPGRHGIIDFVSFDPVQHRFRFHDSGVHRHDNLFTRLTEDGISCGSIFLPCNYPPYPLERGYVISGFETPGTGSNFTEPAQLRDEILGVSPNLHFNFEDDWEDDRNEEIFSRNIERAIGAVDLLERLAVHFQRERPVQLQVAYLQATDILFHKAWRWCDPKSAGQNELRHELAKKFFRRVDQLLNRGLGVHTSSRISQRFRPGGPKLLKVICSDHGHCLSRGRVYINSLLYEWGFLRPISSFRQASRRLALLTLSPAARRARSRELPLDWSHTSAYLAHVGIYGFVYINLEGREAAGIVPKDQFESVRNELIGKFLAEKIPGTDQPLFPKVLKGEEVYARKDELNMPDLVVVPAEGFFPRRKFGRGGAVKLNPDAVGGVHTPNGIYAFSGQGIAPSPGLGPRANIADIAPTLLAALGQPVPRTMTGKPLLHIFQDQPRVCFYDEARRSSRRKPPESAYTREEERLLERRLSDLGYLE